jgi:PAS domain S-box-containing protein
MSFHRALLGKWLLTLTVVFAAGSAGFLLPSLGAHLSMPLLPSGIAVAACIRWGKGMWPAIFVAGIGINLWTNYTVLGAFGVGCGAAAAAVMTAWVLQLRDFDPNFSRARDVSLFIVTAAIGMMLTPTLGLIGARLAGDRDAFSDPVRWISWWSNNVAGVMLVGPLLVAISRRSLAQMAEHWAEGALWLVGVAACCSGALSWSPSDVERPLIVMFALLLIVVGAIRFGLVVTASGALFISAAAACSFAFGRGVFGQLGELAGFTTIWSFSAALTGLCLIIIALLAERDSAAIERLRAEQRYAQIFDGSPQPLWVHDPHTLAFLLVNSAMLRQYGFSREQFLASHVSILAATDPALVPPQPVAPASDGQTCEPCETRHRTRDGRVLDVELWTRAIDLGGRPAVLVFAVDVTERRALGNALIDAISTEQRRIGQEMHDGLGQELTGLALSARALATRAERDRQPIAEALDQLAVLAASCIQAARRIAQGLSPLSDPDGNLPAALEALATRSSIGGTVVRFRSRLELPLTLDLESRNQLYRIAQEAVQNALKHARARSVEIDLWAHSAGLSLTINDDGVGLPVSGSRGAGLGMRTMRFRASSVGGRLTIASREQGGVTVSCDLAQPGITGAPG